MIPLLNTGFSTLAGYQQLAAAALRCQCPPRNRAGGAPLRVGIIVWDFAPSISGGVYRPAALARHLPLADMAVRVLAGPAPKAPTAAGLQLLAQIGERIAVHRVGESEIRTSYRFFPRIDGGLLNAIEMFNAARRAWKDSPPHVLIASGPPFHNFVAGYYLSRYFGSKLILDYRDEWSLNPFDFVKKGPQDKAWESRCLSRADRIVLTTDSQKTLLEQTYPGAIGDKCIVIPNGWESDGDPQVSSLVSGSGEKALLLFAGKLGGHTHPDNFLQAVESLLRANPGLERKLLIRFVGNKTPASQAALSRFPFQGIVESCPVVPLQEVQSLMGAADALLLFHDERFKRYLPGKLYEYLAARKPILLIDDCGESSRLVHSLNSGWSIKSSDVNAIHQVILDILAAKSRQGETSGSNDDLDIWLKANTRARMAAKFQECIERLQEN